MFQRKRLQGSQLNAPRVHVRREQHLSELAAHKVAAESSRHMFDSAVVVTPRERQLTAKIAIGIDGLGTRMVSVKGACREVEAR